MKTRKKEKQIIEKILTKVMESGMLLNGNGHFIVREDRGRITWIEIYNGLFLPESEIGCIQLGVTQYEDLEREDIEISSDLTMIMCKKSNNRHCVVRLQKDKSEVLRKFLDYIEENKHQILQCDDEHGCSLFVTDVDFI